MGRHNYPAAVPQRQRSCLPAVRELRGALKDTSLRMAHKNKNGFINTSVGLQRPLSFESAELIIDQFHMLQTDGLVPENIERRLNLHVTIMPRRRLDRQLRRGFIMGYEFGKTLAATKQEIQDNAPPLLHAKLGEIAILKNHFIVHKIESQVVQDEVDEACLVLGRFGIKGMMKERLPLHITLGQTAQQNISIANQKYLVRELNDVMPVGDEVILQNLEIYPQPPQLNKGE